MIRWPPGVLGGDAEDELLFVGESSMLDVVGVRTYCDSTCDVQSKKTRQVVNSAQSGSGPDCLSLY